MSLVFASGVAAQSALTSIIAELPKCAVSALSNPFNPKLNPPVDLSWYCNCEFDMCSNQPDMPLYERSAAVTGDGLCDRVLYN